jgi:hypothetical protein
MSMTREEHEQIADLIADAIKAQFDKLRADIFERMLELRTPRWAITPKGEVYVGGELAGDVRPVFQSVVTEALKVAGHIRAGGGDDAGR